MNYYLSNGTNIPTYIYDHKNDQSLSIQELIHTTNDFLVLWLGI